MGRTVPQANTKGAVQQELIVMSKRSLYCFLSREGCGIRTQPSHHIAPAVNGIQRPINISAAATKPDQEYATGLAPEKH